MSRRRIPRLHVVTDDAVLSRPDFLEVASAVLEAGGEDVSLHVRAPNAAGRVLHATARALLAPARGSGALLLVNDRVDVAIALGLAGAHLGVRSLPLAAARRLLGPAAVLGASTHSAAQLATACREGADFVFAGPVHATLSHPGAPGRGLGALSEATPEGTPVVAIGGVDEGRVAAAVRAGAHGVAVIRGVWAAPHPPDAVIRYLHALDREREGP